MLEFLFSFKCAVLQGMFFEINSVMQTIWKYINPVGPLGPFSQGSTPGFNLAFNVNFVIDSF